MRRKTVRKGLLVFCIIGAVALGGVGGYHWYKLLRQHRLINQASNFLAASDDKNALLCLERALASNPKDPDACRLMANLAEATHSPAALIWRRRVVEYNPGSLDDRLNLAESAISARDYPTAAAALDQADQAGKKTVGYHNVAGALAAATGHMAQAEAHFQEAARLEPANIQPLLNIAILRLRSTNESDLAGARSFLRTLSSNPTNSLLRWKALRELTADAMRHRQTNSALALSKELLQQTNSVFDDQILRLDVLVDTGNAGFLPALAAVRREAARDPGKVAELASWQMTKIPPGKALAWLRSLPVKTQDSQPVAMVMTECYNQVQDWRGLQAFLEPQKWGEMEFSRHAFLARALRGQQLTAAATSKWVEALKAAGGRKQNLVTLLGLATQWGWSSEAEELLWDIVNNYPDDHGAFQALGQTLFQAGRTRSLLELYTLAVRRDPSSLPARNNVAYAALLLDAQELNPHELAQAVYQEAPANPACATTYALSLLLQNKTADAVKVFEGLNPGELENPSVAGCYGLALQSAGQRVKAKKYLEIGSRAPMLPEQRKLIEKAIRGT